MLCSYHASAESHPANRRDFFNTHKFIANNPTGFNLADEQVQPAVRGRRDELQRHGSLEYICEQSRG